MSLSADYFNDFWTAKFAVAEDDPECASCGARSVMLFAERDGDPLLCGACASNQDAADAAKDGRDPVLRAGLRFRGTRAYVSQSAVVRYIAWGMSATPEQVRA